MQIGVFGHTGGHAAHGGSSSKALRFHSDRDRRHTNERRTHSSGRHKSTTVARALKFGGMGFFWKVKA